MLTLGSIVCVLASDHNVVSVLDLSCPRSLGSVLYRIDVNRTGIVCKIEAEVLIIEPADLSGKAIVSNDVCLLNKLSHGSVCSFVGVSAFCRGVLLDYGVDDFMLTLLLIELVLAGDGNSTAVLDDVLIFGLRLGLHRIDVDSASCISKIKTAIRGIETAYGSAEAIGRIRAGICDKIGYGCCNNSVSKITSLSNLDCYLMLDVGKEGEGYGPVLIGIGKGGNFDLMGL